MIKESSPNSHIRRWLEFHQPEERIFGKEELQKIIQDSATPQTQARYWRKLDAEYSSYESVREPLSNAFKEMLSHVFSRYVGNFDTAVEVGCGPHASYYKLLPERCKRHWTMCDANGVSVHVAKGEHREGVFLSADFHETPFKDESAGIVAGFNAFETTRHLDVAVGEAYRILKPSGYLLAIQDVISSSFATIIKEHERTGKDILEAKVSMMSDDTPVLIKTEYGDIDARSYHMGLLQESGRSAGLNTIFNGIIESGGFYPRTAKHDIKISWKKENPFNNSFVDLAALPRFTYDPSIPERYVLECVAANILVMKK